MNVADRLNPVREKVLVRVPDVVSEAEGVRVSDGDRVGVPVLDGEMDSVGLIDVE